MNGSISRIKKKYQKKVILVLEESFFNQLEDDVDLITVYTIH